MKDSAGEVLTNDGPDMNQSENVTTATGNSQTAIINDKTSAPWVESSIQYLHDMKFTMISLQGPLYVQQCQNIFIVFTQNTANPVFHPHSPFGVRGNNAW